jgi:hypothetical protein
MKSFTFLVLILFFLFTAQEKPLLLLNATVHFGNGESIENAALAIGEGKVLFLADARVVKLELEKFQVIEGRSFHVYPYELVDPQDKKIFITEFNNLISIYSSSDSTLTGKIFHNQLDSNYFDHQPESLNLIVLTKDWSDKRGVQIRHLIKDGRLMPK